MEADKICIHCHVAKPLAAFGKNPSHRQGRDNRCKDCMKAYQQTPARMAWRQQYMREYHRKRAGR